MFEALKDMGAEELSELIRAAEAERQAKLDEARRQLKAEFEERAAKLNLTVDDVIREPERQRSGGKVAPKYRGPGGEEWSGRGKPPKWLVALEGSGHSRDDFKL
ncbi:H-NS histone family protein [Methylobacterium sp. WL64]|uniref:H-NS histone family protein n=1 Tax=Methylobacterium sp. WL64 TaxID=2603894 RepID=UPI0011CB8A09|nr:H-NS histone family protein [Methylobacterium sp. WL64]TXN01985.1 H-NS histone family protein [Methylobacterium sp. WL64]